MNENFLSLTINYFVSHQITYILSTHTLFKRVFKRVFLVTENELGLKSDKLSSLTQSYNCVLCVWFYTFW